MERAGVGGTLRGRGPLQEPPARCTLEPGNPAPLTGTLAASTPVALFLGLLVIATPSASPAADWIELRSRDGWVAYSNCDPGYTKDLLAEMGQFRARLFASWEVQGATEIYVPLQVFVFRDEKDFERYTGQGGYGGFFVPSGWTGHIALYRPEFGSPLPTVFHEYVHFHLGQQFADLPRWLDEGLATYYETVEIHDDRTLIGRPPAILLQQIHSAGLLPLSRFLSISAFPPGDVPGSRQGLLYAQAWALTHFLMMRHPQGEAAVVELTRRVSRGQLSTEALAEVTGLSLEELDRELAAYVGQKTMNYLELENPERAADRTFRERSVDDSEMMFLLNDLAAFVRPVGEIATDVLDRVAEENPTVGLAQRTRGTALMRKRNRTAALEATRAAAELAPDDPIAHYLTANLLVDSRWRRAIRKSRVSSRPVAMDEAKEHLVACLRIEPDFAEAHVELAKCAVLEGAVSPTHSRTAQRIWSSVPGRADIGIVLYECHLRAGELGSALDALSQLVLGSPGSPEVRSTTDAMASRFLWAIADELEAGEAERAGEHLAGLERLLADHELDERVERHRAELGARIAEAAAGGGR